MGILGAGWWAAHTHAPQLRAAGNVEIVAACRRDPARLKEFADKVGVPQTFTRSEEMLEKAELDAVVVCSPHALHAEHVRMALERGFPVLTDKPLAIRSSDGDELIALAEAKQLPLAVFFGHCYDPVYRFAARQIREDRLGRLAHITCACYANPDALGFFGNAEFQPNPEEFPILPTQFRADAEMGGGGYLQDVGNHAMSALLIGTGLRLREVSCLMDSAELDLRATVQMRFSNGALGTVTVAADLRPPLKTYFGTGHYAATADLGGMWRGPGDGALWLQRWGEPAEQVAAERLPSASNPDANFIAHLRGEEELIAPATEAIHCVRAIEAAYLSARTGKSVRIEVD